MMLWTRKGFSAGAVLALVFVTSACTGGGPSKEDQAKEEEWVWLNDTKAQLDAKRQELAELQAQLAEAEEEPTAAEGEEVEAAGVAPGLHAQQLEAEIDELGEELGGRVVTFINADPPIEGEDLTERQLALFRMKSDEDMVMAQEWIEKGGDYRKAIEIYATALTYDPDNERLKAALAEAEIMRYMTEERFASAKKGMTQNEVRQALGQPNLHNVREFPERNVVAWFYPTGEGGSAAAVWFEPDKQEEFKVYKLEFEGVKGRGEIEGP